ncbi:hypothetical protein IP92_05773 [Pseudoduganella flava]|uniref:Uncharacterized protein n=1 Tax=Pseudoduganella flava TaxID=871742 RepID=A0A562P9C5_9BURK|nr:hypothetical protein IP92_05773 [Pseudoduganella flava]
MCEPIIPRAAIREKAQAAFIRGEGRDEHEFNWHAAAIAEWQAEWDRCAAEQAGRAEP